ncbi:uncharacterized protein [Chanodichthys erythropterus]|uniref:uncharacterized protein isoform X3 n=2 Tax=Chanodichthys erythropterus TaxID=933992 RepID=UPI00351F1496
MSECACGLTRDYSDNMEVIESYIQTLLNSKGYGKYIFLFNHFSAGVVVFGERSAMSRHSFRKYLNRTSQKVLVVDPQGLDEAKESELAAERFRTYFKMRQILYGKTDWVDVAWTHGVLKHTIQKDSCSCGVYVMQMAKEVVESFPETPSKIRIPSSQHILSELRKEMAVTILEASVFNPKDHCSFCGQESPAGRVGLNTWIQCSSFARWYHAVCVNITKKGVRKLKRALWLCAFCK